MLQLKAITLNEGFEMRLGGTEENIRTYVEKYITASGAQSVRDAKAGLSTGKQILKAGVMANLVIDKMNAAIDKALEGESEIVESRFFNIRFEVSPY